MLSKNIFKIIGIVLLIGCIAWVFAQIVTYFLIALVLSTILSPIANYINNIYIFKVRMPRTLAVLLAILVFISTLASFVLLYIPLISDQVQLISSLEYNDVVYSITKPIGLFEDFLVKNFSLNIKKGFLVNELQKNILSFFKKVDISLILGETFNLAGSISIGTISILFITFFLVYERGLVKNLIIRLIPNAYFELGITTLYKIEHLLSKYLLGLLVEIISIFSLLSIGLMILDVNYAITIALFAAIVHLIPYAGSFLGVCFALIVGMLTASLENAAPSYGMLFFKIIGTFATVFMIDNFILQPIIYSKSVKAHPLELFMVIFAGAALAGGVGMIAAIPFYTVLRVSFTEFRNGYKQYHVFQK